MEYLLMAMEDQDGLAQREDPARRDDYWAAWSGYVQALVESGCLRGAGGLQPPRTATTLRLRDGRRTVQDGPFAETKEALGGYFVIDVQDLDVALDWAERCPCAASGSVEIRPVLPPAEQPAPA